MRGERSGTEEALSGTLSAIGPSGRYWSLGFGVVYLAGAVWVGFNLDLVWTFLARDGVSGQARHLVSVLTTVFPHIFAIPGFILLIAGQRLSRSVFAVVAAIPFAGIILGLIVRARY